MEEKEKGRLSMEEKEKGRQSQARLLVQNLEDAGCTEEFIRRFLESRKEGNRDKQKRLLAGQRCRLLDDVHENQKRLDCLDYLIYEIKKEEKEDENDI